MSPALLLLAPAHIAADCPEPPPVEGCGLDTRAPAVVWLPVVVR